MKELDEIFENNRKAPDEYGHEPLDEYEAVRQIKKLMLDTLKECIGEMEETKYTYESLKAPVRNQLRQSALTKLEEKLDLIN